MMPDSSENAPTSIPATARVLDPVSRASEVLFGLIMVLTFTLSLNAAEAGTADVRRMLIAALGCNLAWGMIDAAMYLLSVRSEKAISHRTLESIRSATSPAVAYQAIIRSLPPLVAQALDQQDLERIRQRILSVEILPDGQSLDGGDFLAAAAVFLLVFVATLPVVLPFVLIEDPTRALRLSNIVAIALLFLAGYTLGRNWGRPWHVGLTMIAVGIALVGIALALGG